MHPMHPDAAGTIPARRKIRAKWPKGGCWHARLGNATLIPRNLLCPAAGSGPFDEETERPE